MTDQELDEIIEKGMEYEDEKLLEMIRNDPSLEGVEAPDYLQDRIFAEIREIEREQALKREREERMRLEKRFKRAKRWNKIVVLIAAIVCVLALGITSMGGPKRMLEEFKRTIAGREQSYVNNDDGSNRTGEMEIMTEDEAIETINNVFGVAPVKLYYLPQDVYFSEMILEKETQNARLYYEGEKGETISYIMLFNYRAFTRGKDIEDSVKKKYELIVEEVPILVQQLEVEGSNVQRWRVEFKYGETQYYIETNGIKEAELEKIVKNLYFF